MFVGACKKKGFKLQNKRWKKERKVRKREEKKGREKDQSSAAKCSANHTHTRSLTRSLTHSLTHSHTRSLTHSLTHTLSLSQENQPRVGLAEGLMEGKKARSCAGANKWCRAPEKFMRTKSCRVYPNRHTGATPQGRRLVMLPTAFPNLGLPDNVSVPKKESVALTSPR